MCLVAIEKQRMFVARIKISTLPTTIGDVMSSRHVDV